MPNMVICDISPNTNFKESYWCKVTKMLKKCKANNTEAIQFHAPKLGVVEQLHTRYKSIKFHGNLKNECILVVGLTWNYPISSSDLYPRPQVLIKCGDGVGGKESLVSTACGR